MSDFTGMLPQDNIRPSAACVEPASSVPLLNLGYVPEAVSMASPSTHEDRQLDMYRLLSNPVEALLQAVAEWLHVTEDPEPTPALACVQVLDLTYGGTVAENISRRQVALLAHLIRHDAQLRRQHAIPSAPIGAQR